MFKAYAARFNKPVADENDSVDEMETMQTEDGIIPHTLPESCSMTKNAFLNKGHIPESPNRHKPQFGERESPNPLQVRSQSQEHKEIHSFISQQANQLQSHYNHLGVSYSPFQYHNAADLPPASVTFNPKGLEHIDTSFPSSELANKMFHEKFASTTTQAKNTSMLNSSGTKSHRNLNQFLEDQNKHLERVEAKKKKIAEEQLEKMNEGRNHRPELCQKSVKMAEKKNQEKQPAYQRLYNSSKKTKTNPENITNTTNNFDLTDPGCLTIEGESPELQVRESKSGSAHKFQPEIQRKSKIMKRDEKVDSLLYNDALRRQNKFNDIPKPAKTKSGSVTMSSTSKRAIANRFIKEFDIVIDEVLNMGRNQTLNYVQLNELLNRLCFLKGSENLDNPNFIAERTLLYDSWYILHADKYKGAHRRNLLVFLLAVLNLHFPITKIIKDDDLCNSPSEFGQDRSHNPLLTEENEPLTKSLNQSFHPVLPEGQAPREKILIGVFDEEGNYELSEEEVRHLHNLFEPWYLNRLCAGDNLGQFVGRRSQEDLSFHPEINQTSKELARNYREKILTGTADLIQQNKVPMPKDGKLTHADLLIVSKKVVEEKVNKYGDLLKEEQTKDLTFKPQISPYTPVSHGDGNQERKSVYASKEKPMTPEPMGKDRVYELYALTKLRTSKHDKSPIEKDFEKNFEQCTFQPNKNLKREGRSTPNNSSGYFAKGIEKSVERIRNARLDKEQQAEIAKNSRDTYNGHFVTSLDRSIRNTSREKTPNKERRSKSPINNTRDTRETPSQLKDTSMNKSYSQMMKRESIEQTKSYLFPDHPKQTYEGFGFGHEEPSEVQKTLQFTNYGDQSAHSYVSESQKRATPQEISPFLQNNFEDKIDENEDDRVPLLLVDVNLGQGKMERITIYEGDTAEGLAQKFSEQYGLEPLMKSKLKELLNAQIAGLLSRIEEELQSGHSHSHSETDRHYKKQY